MPQLALLNTCTKIVFGVGNTAADSTIFSSNTVTHAAVEPYRQQGAVAIIAGVILMPLAHLFMTILMTE